MYMHVIVFAAFVGDLNVYSLLRRFTRIYSIRF